MKGMNLLIGTLFLLAGIAALAGTGVIVAKAVPELSSLRDARLEAPDIERSCRNAASRLGLQEIGGVEGERLRFAKLSLGDSRRAYAEASALVMACEGYELQRFCAGEDCEPQPLHLTLEPQGP